MKKTTISIAVDEEKLSAIKMYMTKKDADLDAELISQLEKLYEKFVPAGVREFISERYNEDENNSPKRLSQSDKGPKSNF